MCTCKRSTLVAAGVVSGVVAAVVWWRARRRRRRRRRPSCTATAPPPTVTAPPASRLSRRAQCLQRHADAAMSAALRAGEAATAALNQEVYGDVGHMTPELDGVADVASRADDDVAELIFMGSGSSTGTPRPLCLMHATPPDKDAPCDVCRSADAAHVAAFAPNMRGNPSVLLRFRHPTDGRLRHVLIDAGKTFHQAAVRWFPRYAVPSLDAVVVTHGHADAFLGLDDLRGLQWFATESQPACAPVDLFMDAATTSVARRVFPYLYNAASASADGVERKVAHLAWHVIEPHVAFQPAGPAADDNLCVTPLPVVHGEGYTSLGFAFGRRHRVVYISDVSRVPPATLAAVTATPVHTLVVDALLPTESHPSHFSLNDAMDFIQAVAPAYALVVGGADRLGFHATAAALAARFPPGCGTVARPARDGLRWRVQL